ncbi:MAG: hypothetical protein ACFFG0_35500 [Candidatus Thorarchaeota archaeon]
MLIVKLGSYISILGVELIVLEIITPKTESNLNYLTNMSRIKDRETKRRYKLLEIWASFPVFMGIHNIFFLIFGLNDDFRCHEMSLDYVIILVLPWLILMVFYVIYTSVVVLKK